MDWKSVTETLEIDRAIRVTCPVCADTAKNLSVHRLRTGATAYCFKCAYRGFHRIRGLNAPFYEPVDVLDKHIVPPDATLDIPVEKLDWLLKYGITASEREYYKIQYTPKYDRIVIPVYDEQLLVGSVSRRLNSTTPCKYITRTIGTGQVFKAIRKEVKYPYVLVITEDILSAIKVGRQFNAVSLLGTGVSDSKVAKTLRYVQTFDICAVIVWLDNDTAGHRATKQFTDRWKLISDIPVIGVCTQHDPKVYQCSDIERYVTTAKWRAFNNVRPDST